MYTHVGQSLQMPNSRLKVRHGIGNQASFQSGQNIWTLYYGAREVSCCVNVFGHHNLYRHTGVRRNIELVATLKQKLGKLVTTVSPLNPTGPFPLHGTKNLAIYLHRKKDLEFLVSCTKSQCGSFRAIVNLFLPQGNEKDKAQIELFFQMASFYK